MQRLRVRDLVPAFLEFWDGNRQLDEYISQHPEVAHDLARSGRPLNAERRTTALRAYQDLEDRIRANAPHATRWIEQAADRVVPLLDAAHIPIDAVVMVGLATSNGWVSDHTLHLAVEMIPDERAADILAAHEIAHALQFPLPDEPWPEEASLGQNVYSEGFATALTTELFPQYSLAEHLWFGPGYGSWLADCARHEQAARDAILENLHSKDDDVVRRFLMITADVSPFPPRIGYFVGTRLIQDLRRTFTWPDLARWSTERAMGELHDLLGSKGHPGS